MMAINYGAVAQAPADFRSYRRGWQHAERILLGLQAPPGGYAGYNRLIASDRVGPDIRLAHCWARALRKLVEITRTGPTPIADEGVKQISELYSIEAELRGSAEARLGGRQERSAPLIDDMRTWLTQHRTPCRWQVAARRSTRLYRQILGSPLQPPD